MKSYFVYCCAVTLAFAIGHGAAQTSESASKVDESVISTLRKQFGIRSRILKHLDLTQEFQTKSRWSLVVAKQPDEESNFEDGRGNRVGAFSFCFVLNDTPDCSEELLLQRYREGRTDFRSGEPAFHHLIRSEVVFSGPGKTLPLLWITVCEYVGANGNCGVSTFLVDYDRKSDRFRVVFFNQTGRNQNEETRFVESGPLLGSVIVAYPMMRAPFKYMVDLYRRTSRIDFSKVVSFRSGTSQGDGNPLAVIDSEMPELLRRMNLWKPGDALPMPPQLPTGCGRLTLRKGVLWCE